MNVTHLVLFGVSLTLNNIEGSNSFRCLGESDVVPIKNSHGSYIGGGLHHLLIVAFGILR